MLAVAIAIVLAAAGYQGWRWYDQKRIGAVATDYMAAMRTEAEKGPAREAALSTLRRGRRQGRCRLPHPRAPAGGGAEGRATATSRAPAGCGTRWRTTAAPIRCCATSPTCNGRSTTSTPATPAEVAARLAPLAAPTNPWHPLAAEAQAMLDLRQGKREAARTTLQELSRDPLAPQGVRRRADGLLAQPGPIDDDTEPAPDAPRRVAVAARRHRLRDLWTRSSAPRRTPLPGKRIAVVGEAGASRSTTRPIAGSRCRRRARCRTAPQAGGSPSQSMGHPAVRERLDAGAGSRIGEGGGYRQQDHGPPVVAGGRIFTMDSDAVVTAFDLQERRARSGAPTPRPRTTTAPMSAAASRSTAASSTPRPGLPSCSRSTRPAGISAGARGCRPRPAPRPPSPRTGCTCRCSTSQLRRLRDRRTARSCGASRAAPPPTAMLGLPVACLCRRAGGGRLRLGRPAACAPPPAR